MTIDSNLEEAPKPESSQDWAAYNAAMSFLRYPVAALTALALLLALAAFWPTAHLVETQVNAPIAEEGLTMSIDLDAPAELRLGTTEVIRLSTQLETAAGLTPQLPPGSLTVVNVDSACVAADPPNETLQAAIVGQSQGWTWVLSPRPDAELGPCEVDVVVRLRYGTDERIVWVKQMQVITASVMGLPAPTAQAVGLSGSMIGFVVLAVLQLKIQLTRKPA